MTTATNVADRLATAGTLDELRDIIAEIVRDANEFQLSALDRQLAALPTFGGEDMTGREWEGEPIWSWDSTRLLVGAGDMRIVERPANSTDDDEPRYIVVQATNCDGGIQVARLAPGEDESACARRYGAFVLSYGPYERGGEDRNYTHAEAHAAARRIEEEEAEYEARQEAEAAPRKVRNQ